MQKVILDTPPKQTCHQCQLYESFWDHEFGLGWENCKSRGRKLGFDPVSGKVWYEGSTDPKNRRDASTCEFFVAIPPPGPSLLSRLIAWWRNEPCPAS